jgi:hypothetical protein
VSIIACTEMRSSDEEETAMAESGDSHGFSPTLRARASRLVENLTALFRWLACQNKAQGELKPGIVAVTADEATILQAYAKAVPALKCAIEMADGDFRKIDFAAIRERWLTMLSPRELTAIAEYEAVTEGQQDADRITADMTDYLRQLGCRNPPKPTLH